MDDLDKMIAEATDRRRQRQLALLATPDPYGEATLDILQEQDELSRSAGDDPIKGRLVE
jgi:hypothetical protein